MFSDPISALQLHDGRITIVRGYHQRRHFVGVQRVDMRRGGEQAQHHCDAIVVAVVP